ncbi:MAG: bifunctional phosphopantothenoylcysteine decarboxylase/phosphopantothenate--cysteine ligase CoaBC [Candidatus Margulisiibacteriota bacterium]
MPQPTSPEVVFGISGSISAYKSVDIIRLLRTQNIVSRPLFSESAHRFVTPWTVETLAEYPLINEDIKCGKITHLDVCRGAALFVICPASANCIAKLAQGLATDLISTSFLSFRGPRVLFPAMHTEMWEHPVTQKNIQTLKSLGVIIVDPDQGALACGDSGKGRLPEPELIANIIQYLVNHPCLDLSDQKVVVTCGGTTEPIDPVRVITNTASGISGHIIANIAALFGAEVTLIRTKSHPTLATINTINVGSANEMADALHPFTRNCDCLIMNAAVSDFTISQPESKKQARQSSLNLNLTPTPDLLKTFNLAKAKACYSIGFCLSDRKDIIDFAEQKRVDKGCELIIANHVDSFGQSTRTVHFICKEDVKTFQAISLLELAYHLLWKFKKFYETATNG